MLQRKSLDGVEILSVDISDLRELLKEISRGIKYEHPEVKEIILFGSFSKGNFTPYSDIDIALIVNDTDKRFIERQDEFIGYFKDIGFDTNIIVYTQKEIERMRREENKFIKEIEKGEKINC